MRTIKVKFDSSKYKLEGDDGTYLGELTIIWEGDICRIDISRKGAALSELSIGH